MTLFEVLRFSAPWIQKFFSNVISQFCMVPSSVSSHVALQLC